MQLGPLLRELMGVSGVNQADLAKALAFSTSELSKYVNGSRLPAAGAHPADTAVHAAFRPAAVRPVADGGLRRTVRSLLPHGDLVRVRTEDLAADLSGQQVAAHALRPGAPVRLAVPREDVATYRA